MSKSKRASLSVYDQDEVPTGDEEAIRISNAIDENLRVRIHACSPY